MYIKEAKTTKHNYAVQAKYPDLISLFWKKYKTHSSTLAWKIPWIEEPGKLQSMGSLRDGHDWATSLSLSLLC